MGTRVLLPQDCLPIARGRQQDVFTIAWSTAAKTPSQHFNYSISQSSHTESVSHHEIAPTDVDECRVRPLSLDRVQKESDQKKSKFRKAGSAKTHVSDFTSFAILQRPKDNDVSHEPTVGLLNMPNTQRSLALFIESKPDKRVDGASKADKIARSLSLDRKKKNGSNEKRVPFDSEGRKKNLSDSEIGNPINRAPGFCEGHWLVKNVGKGAVVIKSNNQSVLTDAMKVRRNSDNTCNNMHQILNPERSSHSPSSKTIRGGLARLRRAATDPQITEHLGHYKTQVIDAHSTQGKLYHGVHRSCSMSLPAERWAGPAFISSPAPSSLPLPKFSLISQKLPSMDAIPLSVEEQKSTTAKPLRLGSVSLKSRPPPVENESDVALAATKNLRRMLRLDPS